VEKGLEQWLARHEALAAELEVFRQRQAGSAADEIAKNFVLRDGIKFATATVTASDTDALRSVGSQVSSRLGEGVVVLGSVIGAKAAVVAFCSPAAISAGYNAGKLVGSLSQILGGKGGGRPDFAMGGGRDAAKLPEALLCALPKA
jgi:alanyl-tRNA synthetase